MVTTRWVIVLLLVLPMAVLAAELGKLMFQQTIFAPIYTEQIDIPTNRSAETKRDRERERDVCIQHFN